ncbi:hypothetical protein T05_7988 [Trichinella murrelli]|uniref:Uncharacterized protein n=1 Tax=Trichinella murrelli TaxID=144512 RepID=A0A0V0UDT6_9BILA|nr:hypothetical protein T05_7988 [Trichinella murrelli]
MDQSFGQQFIFTTSSHRQSERSDSPKANNSRGNITDDDDDDDDDIREQISGEINASWSYFSLYFFASASKSDDDGVILTKDSARCFADAQFDELLLLS